MMTIEMRETIVRESIGGLSQERYIEAYLAAQG